MKPFAVWMGPDAQPWSDCDLCSSMDEAEAVSHDRCTENKGVQVDIFKWNGSGWDWKSTSVILEASGYE
tara:strand:+ start:4385 stop:4591 length:207 start_codon:yes stop_codon:yes gene_type:complete